MGVLHAGFAIGPLADPRRCPLPFQHRHFGVGAGLLITLGGQEPHQVAAPGGELLHPVAAGGGQQGVLLGDQRRSDLVVETGQHRRDRVEVTGGDLPGRQRRFEQGMASQAGTRLSMMVDRTSIAARRHRAATAPARRDQRLPAHGCDGHTPHRPHPTRTAPHATSAPTPPTRHGQQRRDRRRTTTPPWHSRHSHLGTHGTSDRSNQ